MASHRTGLLGIEYDHLFMGDANNSFTSATRLLPISQQPDQPGRGHGHLARELPLRLGYGGAGRQRDTDLVLIYVVSSKVGRQKCRPFVSGLRHMRSG